MSDSDQQRKIEDWMKKVAKRQSTDTALVWDKRTKRLVAKPKSTVDPDENVPFDPSEATRFHTICFQ